MNFSELSFSKFNIVMVKEIIDLWNNEVSLNSIYAPFSMDSFINEVVNNKYFDEEGMIVVKHRNKIIAFGNAVVLDNTNRSPGFITFIVVKKEFQRKGLGAKILLLLQSYLKDKNKTTIRQMFLNPINLKWIIPNTNHFHPNAPGVLYDSPFYYFLLNNGFINECINQDAYYKNISKYEHSLKDTKNIKLKEEEGYCIKFYDGNNYKEFNDLFTSLNNDGWYNLVKENLNKVKPEPMLIIKKDEEILGWTGPLVTKEDKRASFGGIGIHPKIHGKGLGSLLFKELIKRSKENGATYMTLFTGSNNIARKIYINSGFKIVKSFAILKKEINC